MHARLTILALLGAAALSGATPALAVPSSTASLASAETTSGQAVALVLIAREDTTGRHGADDRVGDNRRGRGKDDPAGDDKGGLRSTNAASSTGRRGVDDPVGDDRRARGADDKPGDDRGRGRGRDDGPNHR